MAKLLITTGFSKIAFQEKIDAETMKKGKALQEDRRIFDVVETKLKSKSTIKAKCIPQTALTTTPHQIEFKVFFIVVIIIIIVMSWLCVKILAFCC
jgi:hypothetical protein